jgi:hypothetical protein
MSRERARDRTYGARRLAGSGRGASDPFGRNLYGIDPGLDTGGAVVIDATMPARLTGEERRRTVLHVLPGRGRGAKPALPPRHTDASRGRFATSVKPQRRTTRAISRPRILDASSRVCPESLQATEDFSPKSGEAGGLKNRCRHLKKNAIGQVFACRILTVCGEVAEWPKAAVC